MAAAVTLTGTYERSPGVPSVGKIRARLDRVVKDTVTNVIYEREDRVLPIDTDGTVVFTDLLPNDDPALSPQNSTWIITEEVGDSPTRTYQVRIPYDAPEGTIDLANLSPIIDAIPGAGYADADTVTILETRLEEMEDLGGIPGPTGPTGATGATGPINTVAVEAFDARLDSFEAAAGTVVPCAAAVTTTVTHNLNTRNVSVIVRRAVAPYDSVIVEDYASSLNTVVVPFDVVPTAGQYTIAVAPAMGRGATGLTGPAGPSNGAPPLDVQAFTTSGTWTKPTAPVGSAPYTRVMAICVGGGAGGASGRRGAAGTARSGGSGGGGGGVVTGWAPLAVFSATETVTVGVGGAGGAAITTDDTNGNPGVTGGSSAFAANARRGIRATGGAASLGGTAAIVAGGVGGSGELQAGTGASSSITAQPSAAPGLTGRGGSGGGAGGGISTGNVPFAGSTGGNITGAGTTGGGRSGGTGGAVDASGSVSDYASTVGENSGATGGGGGGASITGAGGTGGAGNNYGGGGAGGGASLNGFASGAGGRGGDGCVYVVCS